MAWNNPAQPLIGVALPGALPPQIPWLLLCQRSVPHVVGPQVGRRWFYFNAHREPALSAVPAGCVDEKWQCEPWARLGFCMRRQAFRKRHCPKVCTSCFSETPQSCCCLVL